MGNIKNFEILLVGGKIVYFPGDVVRGTCVMDLSKDIKLNFLRITMKGRAKVHWTEQDSDGNTTHYGSRIDYFNYIQTLFGNENSSVGNILPKGRNEFNFAFNLPMEGICMSFEGKCGNIRYRLKAEMGQKWKIFNDKFRKDFIVSTVTDTNRPEFQIPVELNEDGAVCGCCKSGLVSLTARTTRTGYCPGESVPIWAEFSNQSSRTVVPYAKLKQVITFCANSAKAHAQSTLAEVKGSPLKAHDRTSWKDEFLTIPSVVPTLNAGIIVVEYFLKVSLSIPCSRNVTVCIPITIGNVAYNQEYNDQFNNGHLHIPVSLAGTNMPPQFPAPHPFNMNPQFPLPVAPSDMFPQFPIFDPIASRDIALTQNISLPDGSYPPYDNHAYANEPPPPYQENSVNPSGII